MSHHPVLACPLLAAVAVVAAVAAVAAVRLLWLLLGCAAVAAV